MVAVLYFMASCGDHLPILPLCPTQGTEQIINVSIARVSCLQLFNPGTHIDFHVSPLYTLLYVSSYKEIGKRYLDTYTSPSAQIIQSLSIKSLELELIQTIKSFSRSYWSMNEQSSSG